MKKLFRENRGGGVGSDPPGGGGLRNSFGMFFAQFNIRVFTGHQIQNFAKFPNYMTWLHIIRIIPVPIRAKAKF